MTDLIPSLSLATRASVTLTTLAFLVVAYRALHTHAGGHGSQAKRRWFGGVLLLGFMLAAAFTHLRPLRDTLPVTFPVGFAVGVSLAIASLAWPAARAAFDRLSDADIRLLMSFRGLYGGLLLALAATGHLPVSFALTAGLGDLMVAWLAFVVPWSLDGQGPRAGRLLVHGVGALDLVQVLVLAVPVVRPWSLAHGNAVNTVTLPWLAVPLMLAINVHGIRQAWRSPNADPQRDRSEPPGGVRSALSRT